jgi:hypothetical protein
VRKSELPVKNAPGRRGWKGPQAEGCATSKQGLANWLLMLSKRGRRIAPGQGGPGRMEHSLHCYDQDCFHYEGDLP